MQYLEIFDSENTVRATAITPQDLVIWYEISVNAAILCNRLLAVPYNYARTAARIGVESAHMNAQR